MTTTLQSIGREEGRRQRRARLGGRYVAAEWYRRRQLYRWSRVLLASMVGDRGFTLPGGELLEDIGHWSQKLMHDKPGTWERVLFVGAAERVRA